MFLITKEPYYTTNYKKYQMKIQFSAIIDNISAKKDKTLSIKLGTQEMSSEEASHILDLMQKQIWVGFAETEIEELEVPEALPEMHGDKTPSQRLRNILYKIWEKNKKETFPRFYENYMFKLCEQLKDKI